MLKIIPALLFALAVPQMLYAAPQTNQSQLIQADLVARAQMTMNRGLSSPTNATTIPQVRQYCLKEKATGKSVCKTWSEWKQLAEAVDSAK